MAKKSASEIASLKKEIQEQTTPSATSHQAAYKNFCAHLKLLIAKNPHLITTTLSNIFTMRLIGNKTHGDLAEIAIAEFINQYMYNFKSVHVGKDLYRAKEHEEDIKIINEITKEEFPVSLKAYGDGPLQLSTDKNFLMFPKLQKLGKLIEKRKDIEALWKDSVFADFGSLNVLPLIYDEKRQRCNIMVFDYDAARKNIARIEYSKKAKDGCIRCFDFSMAMEIMFAKCVMAAELQTRFNAVCGRIQRTASISRA